MEFDLKIEDSELINYIKKLLIMAMLFFIATTIIGMINALDFADDYLSRGILLFHLHSGTIAWISTGVSAALIWAYTKERTISSHFKNQISRFYKFWQMIIPSYCLIILISFQLETYFVLPIFGFLTVLGFIWAAYLAFIERNNISNFGVPHISFIIGLAIAGYAGFIGTLLGLQYSLKLIFIPGDGIVSHAGAMEIGYIFLIFTGICELFLNKNPVLKLNLIDISQPTIFLISAMSISFGSLLDNSTLMTISVPLQILGFIIFIYRMFPLIFDKENYLHISRRFFIMIPLFLFIVIVFLISILSIVISTNNENDPRIMRIIIALNHGELVGSASGGLFGMISLFSSIRSSNQLKRLENIGFYLMYVGLIGFLVGLAFNLILHFAIIMGVGIILLTIIYTYCFLKY